MSLPPGPRRPRVLQKLGWIVRPEGTLLAAQRERGDIFTLELPNGPIVMVADADAIKAIFTADPAVFQAGQGNRPLLPIVGEHSTLLLDGPRHLRRRRLVLPPFHGERLAAYEAEMQEIARAHVARWPEVDAFAVEDRLRELTLEIILRVVFGVHDAARLDGLRPVLADLLPRGIARFAMLPALQRDLGPWSPWARFLAAKERLDAALLGEIRRRRAAPDLEERTDVLSLLLLARDEDGRPLGDDELRDELVTLVLAGHETTTTALAWTLDLLHHTPAALARAQAEARGGQRATPYLDAVVTESLRLRPPLPAVVRKLAAPATVLGWELPAGTRVAPSVLLAHRDPVRYPEPHAFRPERFLGSSPASTYAWLPFGGGVRRCVGAAFAQLEMRIVLRTVLEARDTRAAAPAPERIRRRAIVLAPAHGGRTVARPR